MRRDNALFQVRRGHTVAGKDLAMLCTAKGHKPGTCAHLLACFWLSIIALHA